MNWQDRIEVKKGNFGEEIAKRYLESSGYVIYKPITDAPHAFDILAVKRDQKEVIICDVKAKARRNKYPDTGINISHYQKYEAISQKHNMPVFLLFIDEMLSMCYGNFLSELKKEINVRLENSNNIIKYPLIEGGIIYFFIGSMRKIANITGNEQEQLRILSTRKYGYVDKTRLVNGYIINF